ncbi:hypothetical protein V1511DRAFT_463726 [Dipodascopsis uninucleata]
MIPYVEVGVVLALLFLIAVVYAPLTLDGVDIVISDSKAEEKLRVSGVPLSSASSIDDRWLLPAYIPTNFLRHGRGATIPHPNNRFPQEPGNILEHFKNQDKCSISSEDIIGYPSTPSCNNVNGLLSSMSNGGRIGLDAPYHSKDCSLWWHSTEQTCNVLSRFCRVIFIGDDMHSGIFGGLMTLLREDIAYGSVRRWDYKLYDQVDCFCDNAYHEDDLCRDIRIKSLKEIQDHDPDLIKCDRQLAGVQIEMITAPQYPISKAAKKQLTSLLSSADKYDDGRPIAVIYGAGQNSKFDAEYTASWLNNLHNTIKSHTLSSDFKIFELFVTPGSTGHQVDGFNTLRMDMRAAKNFEIKMMEQTSNTTIDVLGTWNSTVQTSFSSSGLRSGLSTNLLKSMMVLNWLDVANPGWE